MSSPRASLATPPRASLERPPSGGTAPSSFIDDKVANQMPKAEIGALDFVRRYPECDGKGVVVAVFDTGIDPGAPGLSVCPDGRPKIIDLIDCTGGGDVDMRTKARPTGRTLKGLSGRELSLPDDWPACGEGEGGGYRLGLKAAFELYPPGVAKRVRAERKKAHDAAQRAAVEAAQSAAARTSAAKGKEGGGASGALGEKKAAEEAKARVSLLGKLESGYADPGPLYDVVSFVDDGGAWRVCVDTSERGDLASCALLEPYRVGRTHALLDETSMLNFSVDVVGGGDVVTVCVDAGAHGTHVAGIIGAHFPERPELNGMAPGCQLVGVKIGDGRVDSMETGTALVRALGAAIERGVHVINLSFGEYAHVDNFGRFTSMAAKAVHDHGLTFVTSAGNNGPALTTGGAPGTSSFAITVGAFASQAMMGPQYALRSKLDDIQYTWSSRGESGATARRQPA